MKHPSIAAIAVAAVAFAAPAFADVAVFCQQGTATPDQGSLLGCSTGQINTGNENVLFSDPKAITGPASTVEGITNITKTGITFTSPTDTLLVNNGGGGAATIASTTDKFIDQLTIGLASPQPYSSIANGFTVLDTNLDTTKASGSVTFTIAALDSLLNTESFTTVAFNLQNGGNKFEFRASNGEIITSVSYVSNDVDHLTVETLKQTQVTVSDPTTIPEPTSLALLATALFGFLGIRRILQS